MKDFLSVLSRLRKRLAEAAAVGATHLAALAFWRLWCLFPSLEGWTPSGGRVIKLRVTQKHKAKRKNEPGIE
jgi:hypothetical protein